MREFLKSIPQVSSSEIQVVSYSFLVTHWLNLWAFLAPVTSIIEVDPFWSIRSLMVLGVPFYYSVNAFDKGLRPSFLSITNW